MRIMRARVCACVHADLHHTFYGGKRFYELTTQKTWNRKTKMKMDTDDIRDIETKLWGGQYTEALGKQAQTHKE